MPRSRLSSILAVLASAIMVVLVAACSTQSTQTPVSGTGNGILPASQVGGTVAQLPKQPVKAPPASRLAHGLAPPTNRWFSGLAFGNTPLPVFPLPLSFGLTPKGFGFGLPTVTSGSDTITAGYTPSVSVDLNAASSMITAYDDASVTIAASDTGGKVLGSTVIAEGSPLVSFTAAHNLNLRIGQPFHPAGDGVWSADIGGTTYGLRTSGSLGGDGTSLSLNAGGSAVWFAVPKDGSLASLSKFVVPVRSVSLAYSTASKQVMTELTYQTAGRKDTLIAAMPHQQKTLKASSCALGSYPSAYGSMTLCSGTNLAWSAAAITPSSSLDLAALGQAQKAELRQQLSQDVASSTVVPADSYFGGKALYRLANLLTLATQLGDNSAATTVRTRLDAALREWTDPKGCTKRSDRCFVYDATMKGVVGMTASFGSDAFNDHHFHYGYFLYAASVAAAHDPQLRRDIAPVINLLAADLATSGPSTYFPERRVFDAYAGHSWASGFSPFADGNNQESSSEAVSAWNGLALWAGVTGNASLQKEAVWMLSSEAASANAYWTGFNRSDPAYSGYGHSIVSLNWGGKRDYSTWFSAEANAKLGILLIPMSPVASYLAGDPARIATNVTAATPAGYGVQFGDYLLMYSALGGPDSAKSALVTARDLPEKFIDDANSRSYLLAWIMSH
ncbi:MAG: 1,3-beta-glucanase [Microbacteriaceae bacterium]|nr:1,3-beta-glucanase [Microbacteriaceae bacterium]